MEHVFHRSALGLGLCFLDAKNVGVGFVKKFPISFAHHRTKSVHVPRNNFRHSFSDGILVINNFEKTFHLKQLLSAFPVELFVNFTKLCISHVCINLRR